MASYCSSVSMTSIRRFKGHDLSSVASKRSRTSIRTLKLWSSRSVIRMDITSRSVRSLRLRHYAVADRQPTLNGCYSGVFAICATLRYLPTDGTPSESTRKSM